ncbi:hypothetical protein Q673_16865 [Marinobacter sp. EN3]|jgi:hypothetical protein|uniref:DUF4357 domain-containing protein n=1 Tax=Marinobacter sp. EN3 TaxID=1397533 RepID=UPI0003B8A0DB|nr:DUF4357 domain-containing protein [Marinobacter sp. EN3]ERS08725.1 hypothetical protein Q673_16865 [Marinobacter sp. EN3]
MATIEVDFEVFKELTVRRESESMTENDVIRLLLGLDDQASKPTAGNEMTGGNPWVCKGVAFPHGTEFRATYKGQMYTGLVAKGALVVQGKRFTSPSSAAVSITGNPVNGWRFWECLLPGEKHWKVIAELRN